MTTKKVRKNFWEKFFIYPSFKMRFLVTLVVILVAFFLLSVILITNNEIVTDASSLFAVVYIIIQLATLVFGIIAAYYALRQLVETRFINLDEAAANEMQRSHYSRAFEKWKEAFYIRPEAGVFTNMSEALLIIGDFDNFDQFMQMSQSASFLRKNIFQETSDQIILYYLRTMRHLFVKNQGEAEKHIKSIVAIVKKEGLSGLNWNFMDLERSPAYQDLGGECRKIAENVVLYLSKNIQAARKKEFEHGNYASQLSEPTQIEKL